MAYFVERLKLCRKESNSTQRQVAEAIGTSEQNYQRYERGSQQPTLSVLIALAEYFNVSLDYLTGRSDYPDIIVMGKDGKPVIIEAMSSPKD